MNITVVDYIMSVILDRALTKKNTNKVHLLIEKNKNRKRAFRIKAFRISNPLNGQNKPNSVGLLQEVLGFFCLISRQFKVFTQSFASSEAISTNKPNLT